MCQLDKLAAVWRASCNLASLGSRLKLGPFFWIKPRLGDANVANVREGREGVEEEPAKSSESYCHRPSCSAPVNAGNFRTESAA